jgi:hypothetical protein
MRLSEAPPIMKLTMTERGLHWIAADLADAWLHDWVGDGLAEIEAYLAKHAAFEEFLQTNDA